MGIPGYRDFWPAKNSGEIMINIWPFGPMIFIQKWIDFIGQEGEKQQTWSPNMPKNDQN